ncbi:phage holin family protein [Aureimonas pseudogalii]|uniref:Putative phage tail protein n=1 Tax=Aureimonas pseudogalii TaxID=1744844 RepID=A0A7W6EGA6_9HYPH|nr:phage holin family protein [Aureimonas pseudogalii]MBB3997723.1 putative phage tail protein [Aureimonas pseudogalii]
MSVEPREARSVPDLIGDVLRETTELFRTEGKLIRAEISDKITQVQIGGGSIAAGAICLLVALIVLAQALVIALAHVVGAGWSALIVGVAIALVGVALLAKGKKELETVSLTPDRTVEQLQKDGRLVKDQTR